MNRLFATLFLVSAVCFLSPLPAMAVVNIAWSPVGNPGNLADAGSYGAVGYSYNIGTYDVTNAQYAEFLNAKDLRGTNPLYLYDDFMSNATFGGISFTASNPDGNKYSVIAGNGNHPVNNINWYDAIRFANWLNNGQGSGDTETGAYTLGPTNGGSSPENGDSIKRNAGAKVFLPSENEWYKAAYYNPATSSYFLYPTSSNTTPIASSPTGLANHANYGNIVGTMTDVGAYSGTTSPYGAFDMGGNVFQWNEAGGAFRYLRGCDFNSGAIFLQSYRRFFLGPETLGDGFGFRLASLIPEPSTGVLAILACGAMLWLRKRFIA